MGQLPELPIMGIYFFPPPHVLNAEQVREERSPILTNHAEILPSESRGVNRQLLPVLAVWFGSTQYRFSDK